MSSVSSTTTTQASNKLRSTAVYGQFGNFDKSDGTIPAYGVFQRNLLVAGNLLLGTETIDASGVVTDSDSNIKFTLNKVPYTIPLQKLSFLQNVSSDIQTQISNLSSTGGGTISTLGYITQVLSDTSSTQFGNHAYNKTSTGVNNTAIGSNCLINNTTGNYNTCLGFISLAANSSGGANTAIGYNALGKNTVGNSNTCIGLGAGSNITNGNNNCVLGQYAGLGLVNVTGSTVLGTTADCSFNYSTALGCNAVCTADHQIMLGTVQETVMVPNNLQVNGSINTVSKTVFGYLANCTSDIQQQLTALKSPVTDITWISGVFNTTNIANVCQTNILKFSGSINNISANTFGFLTGLTSNIQNQINNIVSTTPIGSVIMFSGTGQYLPGYLMCNGNSYPIPAYTALFNVIGYTYGGNEATGFFNVPNFQGVFLRGAGNQTLDLQVPSSPKNYISPGLGLFVKDKCVQPSNYIDGITQSVKSFITSANAFGPPNYNFNYSNAVANLQYSTASDTGVVETFPVHTSIQYFIKY